MPAVALPPIDSKAEPPSTASGGLMDSLFARAARVAEFGTLPRCENASQEETQFLQRRIALFAKVAVLISAMFFVVSVVVIAVVPALQAVPYMPRRMWHAAAILVSTLVWFGALRGCWSLRALICLDGFGTLAALAAYGMMCLSSADYLSTRADLEMTLIALVVLLLRAVIIPSRVRHTVIVTTLGMLSVIGVDVAVALANEPGPGHPSPPVAVVFGVVWTIAAIAMTSLISQVIYNLRVKVQEAQQLGQYVLGEKIGEGGMGTVYRARHALLRRPTAIKLIQPERTSKHAIARFEREVQMTAMLTHPNTVSVFDYGHTPDGIFYYAMEYLEGVDLEQLVTDFGPQPPARVVHILEQIAGALAEAHEVGLVHRDIKPANIILCERGRVQDIAKVFDFGLVKSLARAGGDDPQLSTTNAIIGTPLYLAPEALVDPEAIDGRADLYALGAVGYFLLTGKPVFEGRSVMEVSARHLHEAPIAPTERRGEPVPAALEAVILRCLAKNPEARFESAAALRDALLAAGTGSWTQLHAREWWSERKAQPRALQRRPGSPVGSTMAIDFAARSPLGV